MRRKMTKAVIGVTTPLVCLQDPLVEHAYGRLRRLGRVLNLEQRAVIPPGARDLLDLPYPSSLTAPHRAYAAG
jgi:hypothetical protein